MPLTPVGPAGSCSKPCGLPPKKPGRKTALAAKALARALAADSGVGKDECAKILKALAEVGAKQVKSVGKLVIPGLCMIKTRMKPATKAGKRQMFGKVVTVNAKEARTVVNAFCASALQESI